MKSILVHLKGTGGDRPVLAMALRLGRLFAAHLDCIHVVPDNRSILRRAITVEMSASMLVADALRALRTQAEARVESARGTFAAFCQENGIVRADASGQSGDVSAEFHETIAAPSDELLRQARFHDVTVVESAAGHGAETAQADLSRLVVEAGRPVLLAPPTVWPEPLRTVAIAWKSGAEAARALSAAMPIVAAAKSVRILGAGESRQGEADCRRDLEAVARQLRLYGIEASALALTAAHRNSCDSILAAARELGSDLLVMGAYGHSRVRELVLGGFTRQMLDGVALPVLMFH